MAAGLKPYTLIDGAKSIPLNQLPEEAWRHIAGDSGGAGEVEKMYNAVGVLFACVDVRAAALSSMPWHIYQGDSPVWSWEEEDVPEELLFLDGLTDLLFRTEVALCLGPDSEAFWVKEGNRSALKDVRWLTPSTVDPVWDKTKGLLGFERRIGNERIRLTLDEVVYFMRPGLHETQPAKAPGHVAMRRAKVSYNADLFMELFFERGAIKATLLTVPPESSQAERDKLKAWWRRFMSGIRNAWDAGVISTAVEPVVVGEGVSELSNTELDANNAKSIATTMRVPHSLLFSDAANYATSQQDEMNFYTLTIGPDARLIARAVNRQLLNPLGYSLRFDMNSLPLFQEDENERAAAFGAYVSAGLPMALTAEMLGLDLPQGWTYEKLQAVEDEKRAKEEEQARAQAEALQARANGAPGAQGGEREQEVRKFLAWAKKRKHPDPAKFASEILSQDDKLELLEGGDADTMRPFALPSTITPEWVKATLQLDPDDDEAEQAIREEIERRMERELTAALREQLGELIPDGADNAAVAAAPSRVTETGGKVRDVLRRHLQMSADLGVSVAVDQLGAIGFDWTLANQDAAAWVQQYTFDLVGGIHATSRARLQIAVNEWIQNGDPLPELVRELTPTFGRQRARMIAQTETTRAYAEANTAAYRRSGVVGKVEWRTARDERVCPVCGPLHGRQTKVGTPFQHPERGRISIPAHVSCRCWIVPVVGE